MPSTFADAAVNARGISQLLKFRLRVLSSIALTPSPSPTLQKGRKRLRSLSGSLHCEGFIQFEQFCRTGVERRRHASSPDALRERCERCLSVESPPLYIHANTENRDPIWLESPFCWWIYLSVSFGAAWCDQTANQDSGFSRLNPTVSQLGSTIPGRQSLLHHPVRLSLPLVRDLRTLTLQHCRAQNCHCQGTR